MSDTKQELPEWLPKEAWFGYIAMRKQIKKPATDYAIKLAISLLDTKRLAGADVEAILNQSIMNSWQGLFDVVERRSNDRREQPGRANFAALGKHGQVTANNLQEWLEESK
jgi:hypothetical protein